MAGYGTIAKHEELCERTKALALRILRPNAKDADVMGTQLIRSATSLAANYRAAGRARSRADFVSKISVVCEEADETLFWLELLRDSKIVAKERLEQLHLEAKELVAIFTAARHTARSG